MWRGSRPGAYVSTERYRKLLVTAPALSRPLDGSMSLDQKVGEMAAAACRIPASRTDKMKKGHGQKSVTLYIFLMPSVQIISAHPIALKRIGASLIRMRCGDEISARFLHYLNRHYLA